MMQDVLACLDGWLQSQGVKSDDDKYPNEDDRAYLAAHRRKMAARRRAQGVSDG